MKINYYLNLYSPVPMTKTSVPTYFSLLPLNHADKTDGDIQTQDDLYMVKSRWTV